MENGAATPEISSPPENLTRPNPSLEKLRNTFRARLNIISQEKALNEKGEQIPTERAKSAANLNDIINFGWENFSLEEGTEIAIEYLSDQNNGQAEKEKTTAEQSQKKTERKTFKIAINNGQATISGIVENDGSVKKPEENQLLPDITPQIIIESYLKTAFPDITENQLINFSGLILNEKNISIESYAHSLGYVTRDNLAEILGIPKEPEKRREFLAKPENKKYQKVAEKIYGTGETGSTAIPEIPEAQDIIGVLETAGINPQENLQKIKEKIKEHFKSNLGENAQNHSVMQLISGLESKIEENKTLAEIINTHYSTIESGEKPKDNLQELLPAIKNLYDVNGNINEQKAKELKEKITKTGKAIGVGAALIFAILLWRAMTESQGGAGRGMPGM